ncbi:hypothetical protein Pelo_14282 [Pelomyxa schiedti]|nr:hypothetical protein Pelo_14282 [Pelomyxa schiedti]
MEGQLRVALTCLSCHRLLDDPICFPCGHSACRSCCPSQQQPPVVSSNTGAAVDAVVEAVEIKRLWCPVCGTVSVPHDAPCNARLFAILSAFGVDTGTGQSQQCGNELPQGVTTLCSGLPTWSQCAVHPEEKANLFCTCCEALICSICKEEEHMGHPASGIKKAAEITKIELQYLQSVVTQKIIELNSALENFDTTEKLLEEEVATFTQSINAAFKDIEEKIAKRKKELLAQTSSHCMDKCILEEKKTVITTLKNELQTGAEQCKTEIDHSTPMELLKKRKPLRVCLEKLISMAPVIVDVEIKPTTFMVGFHSNAELTTTVELYGHFIQKARLIECDTQQQSQPGQTDTAPRFKLFGEFPTHSSLALLLPLHETSPFCTQSQHSGQPRILLCKTCAPQGRPGQLVCVYCSQLGEHEGHAKEKLPDAVIRTKVTVTLASLLGITLLQEQLTQLCNYLDVGVSTLTQQRKKILEEIQTVLTEAAHEIYDAQGHYSKVILEMHQEEEKAIAEIKSLSHCRTAELVEKLGSVTKLIHESVNSASLSRKLLSMHTSSKDDFLFTNMFLHFQPKFKESLQHTQVVVPHVAVPVDFKSLNSKPNLRKELQEANNTIQELKQKVTELDQENAKVQQEKTSLQEELERATNFLTQLTEQVTTSEEKCRGLQQQLAVLEQEKTKLHQEKQAQAMKELTLNQQLASSTLKITELIAQVATSEQNCRALQVGGLAFVAVACPPCWNLSDSNHTVTNTGSSPLWWMALANLNLQSCGIVRIRFHINKTLSGRLGFGFNQTGILWSSYVMARCSSSTAARPSNSSGYGACYSCECGDFSMDHSNNFHQPGLKVTGVVTLTQPPNGVTCKSAGQDVILIFDSNAHTAAFVINGTDVGVAFSQIVDAPLFPAVAMADIGDSVTISVD